MSFFDRDEGMGDVVIITEKEQIEGMARDLHKLCMSKLITSPVYGQNCATSPGSVWLEEMKRQMKWDLLTNKERDGYILEAIKAFELDKLRTKMEESRKNRDQAKLKEYGF